jgi:ketopantoate reductase
VSEAPDLKRFERAADALRHIPDPSTRLDAIRRAREELEALEAGAVRDARHAGVTWKAIGALYGLSKQGAQQRFRDTPPGRA